MQHSEAVFGHHELLHRHIGYRKVAQEKLEDFIVVMERNLVDNRPALVT